ncbi:MAG TPA: M14 metallopeptidase family protein [Pyrinomonadaceae bacterium]|nr:M14 metallopeptidase family protein [Pyrinomonadaceae bacterium]
MNTVSASLRLFGLILLTAITLAAQVPAPKDTLGFTPGDDRKLASWASIVDYFKKLDAASDRVMFDEIGKTTMGAPFVYATISSAENLKNLEKYKEINAKLADPRKLGATNLSLSDKKARDLVAQGKTIVLITCGIHSTEVGSTLSSMLIAHQLASSTHADIKKILDNTIILLVPSLNPDGVDIVKNWYDKTLGTPYEGTDPPELYHKYVGHDNNRDWYAFTQVETQLTVDKIHNVWHPQIVHDIHQQGARGSRLFLPPYMQPVEPNVPKQIVEGYTELGNYMAKTLRTIGYQGITTNSTYDAWTPARAYSHYHGGVRILSETASAKIATPITVKFDELRVPSDDGYDPKVESANFGPLWKGGEWKLSNITDYMTTAAFALMNHAADNREKWLSRFYEIGKDAVRPRKLGELQAYIIDPKDNGKYWEVFSKLRRAGVEITNVGSFEVDGQTYPNFTPVILASQPYFGFASALLDLQLYPHLLDTHGNPIPPYDVTAHNLALLQGLTRIRTMRTAFKFPVAPSPSTSGSGSGRGYGTTREPDVYLYKSHQASMDEGWTRWILERYGYEVSDAMGQAFKFRNAGSVELQSASLSARTIIFPDQSPASILNGYAKGSMPDEYVGGVGKEGVENLKKFVENGGTLVFLNRSSSFAIEQFKLPVKDVTAGVARKDFYIPGSILRTELDTTHPIARTMPKESIAWFENSPAFELLPVSTNSTDGNPQSAIRNPQSKVIASYPKDPKQILLSGWALGAERIAGKAALVEFTIGKGKIILFGFRPQYRGQSLATFPLLFNAIAQ